MATLFGGFKPEGMQKIATSMGFNEDISKEENLKSFNDYLINNPNKQGMMNDYVTKAIYMAEGGVVTDTEDQPLTTAVQAAQTTQPAQPAQPSEVSSLTPSYVAPASSSVPSTYTPPTQAPIPSTGTASNVPLGTPEQGTPTLSVPSSVNLYTKDYVDPLTGKIRSDLLGGEYNESNITPEILQQRLAARNLGYTGDFGEGGFGEYSGSLYRGLTPDYLTEDKTTVRTDLLGGQYTDPGTIPAEVLTDRFKARALGYTGSFGSGGYGNFLLEKFGQPGLTDSSGNRLPSSVLTGDGTAIDPSLVNTGSSDAQSVESLRADPNQLIARWRHRQAGFPNAFGAGAIGAYVNSLSQDQQNEYWNRYNSANPGGASLYVRGDIDTLVNEELKNKGIPVPDLQPKYTGEGQPDVYLPRIDERQYSQEEIDFGKPKLHQLLRSAFNYTGGFGQGEFGTFFNEYVKQNPGAQATLDTLINNFESGKYSKQGTAQESGIEGIAEQRLLTPGLPPGTAIQTATIPLSQDQFISPLTGQVSGDRTAAATTAALATSTELPSTPASVAQTTTAASNVTQAVDQMQAQQMSVSPQSLVAAQELNQSKVGELQAEQGQGILMDSPVQRSLQDGELITGSADAATAAAFTEQVQAATASPSEKATVQGQLQELTAGFNAANPPSWAAGAIRAAQSVMAQRGLGASSMAGQAIVQAALEAALPVAQADASIFAQFEAQNLSNRQARAMLAAQQRATFIGQEFDQAFQARVQNAAKISDVANLNFSAEQQVQLENSRIANTINLQNLTNRQAIVLAEAASLAQLESQSLSNRQQAAVQNAQAFLQADLTNVSNAQATELFKTQQIVASLFSDQAALNAAAQFNATTENQVTQFYDSLSQQVRQFNATQANAINQFNAGEANTVSRFNQELANQRDQFNATNRLAIDQANAVWRRSVATADTAAVNRTNEINAQNLLGISNDAYNDLWQLYADQIDFANTSADNLADRANRLAIAQLDSNTRLSLSDDATDANSLAGYGKLLGTIVSAGKDSIIGKFLGFSK